MKKTLVIDQGTTSSRAILFSLDGDLLASHQIQLEQFFPYPGWVEHDPENIWSTVTTCCEHLLEQTSKDDIIGLGITNQRETTVIWERETGRCLYNAIVWQDRRTSQLCADLKQQNLEPLIYEKTGLLLDPYFSATKISWILNQHPGAIERAAKGELLFGTIDCFLLWRLTHGMVHATDITNASRTMLFNINNHDWDEELLAIFSIPRQMLPSVKMNSEQFGVTEKHLFGQAFPILAMMGDQQAALIGQGCLQVGTAKCTYGTGCFLMINTGQQRAIPQNKLISTIAYNLHNQVHYALEGSIFAAGAIIKWFIDSLKFVESPLETEVMARSLPDNAGVYLVPAFTGLGAPYWDPDARGAIFGLTRDTQPAHIVRAGLEAIAYQTKDLLVGQSYSIEHLRVDGGVTANAWLMQFLADILQMPIVVSSIFEATALGVSYLAAYNAGFLEDLNMIYGKNKNTEKTYLPLMQAETACKLYQAWQDAIKRTSTNQVHNEAASSSVL